LNFFGCFPEFIFLGLIGFSSCLEFCRKFKESSTSLLLDFLSIGLLFLSLFQSHSSCFESFLSIISCPFSSFICSLNLSLNLLCVGSVQFCLTVDFPHLSFSFHAFSFWSNI
jgi:hypothetical protein